MTRQSGSSMASALLRTRSESESSRRRRPRRMLFLASLYLSAQNYDNRSHNQTQALPVSKVWCQLSAWRSPPRYTPSSTRSQCSLHAKRNLQNGKTHSGISSPREESQQSRRASSERRVASNKREQAKLTSTTKPPDLSTMNKCWRCNRVKTQPTEIYRIFSKRLKTLPATARSRRVRSTHWTKSQSLSRTMNRKFKP